VAALAEVAAQIAADLGVAAPIEAPLQEDASAAARALLSGQHKALLLGNAAAHHPQAGELLALAQWIAQHTGASVGYLTESANRVGAQLVGAEPRGAGLNAGQMLGRAMKALILFNTEPVLDAHDAHAASQTLESSGFVVALTPFKDAQVPNADVLLPITPFSETGGCFVNAEGRVQSFHAVVKPLAESRPGWKVLRVLGNLLGLPGFNHESVEEVRAEALGGVEDITERLSTGLDALPLPTQLNAPTAAFERIADVPIYAADSLVRRSPALQATADAASPMAGLPSGLWTSLGLQSGDQVVVKQGEAECRLPARHDPQLAMTAVRVPAGHPQTLGLGPMFGAVEVRKA
jgi:NADH-quinone oxidoreductase subunit G